MIEDRPSHEHALEALRRLRIGRGDPKIVLPQAESVIVAMAHYIRDIEKEMFKMEAAMKKMERAFRPGKRKEDE